MTSRNVSAWRFNTSPHLSPKNRFLEKPHEGFQHYVTFAHMCMRSQDDQFIRVR